LSDNDKIEECAFMMKMLVEREKDHKDEAQIQDIVEKNRTNPIFSFYDFTNEDWEKVKRCILEQLGHHLDMGVMITAKDHKSWYHALIRDLPMEYTDRNTKYLKNDRRMNTAVVTALDDITDEIVDGFGDPREQMFKRRGLVMGDVQSGKTNTYVRMCCKAADAGYRVIILLTGTIETLRRQTQERMDEGFVGFDSSVLSIKNTLSTGKDSCIGVGKYNNKKKVVTYTSTAMDFRANVANQINVPIESTKDPILFVIKKNKSVLKNLNDWLRTTNDGRQIEEPALLLIDDEADNASVNTAEHDNVTAINREIRDLLGRFRKNTYVGFTATPYANIFIDPDAEEDLFPRDFIYCLRSPSNYVGPESIYSLDEGKAENANMVRIIDAGKYGLPEIPYKHDSHHVIPSIPATLQEALNCFILSCSIRDLRGDSKKHMSMLINVSRFTNVQESMGRLVREKMHDIGQRIGVYSRLPVEEALKDHVIRGLKGTFDKEYHACGFSWKEIQSRLDSVSKSIIVRTVNSLNGASTLNYKDTPDGLRLIAIGGNSLSRGLTLEGLCISYFYRRSASYDTLMQMGRWFGYRPGYLDLCRVWMTESSKVWYSEISEATEDLKRQFECMRITKRTPKDFGFAVMNDINGLMITARNKMRTASNDYITKSVNGKIISTEYVYVDPENVKANMTMIEDAISKVESSGIKAWWNNKTENYVWRKVSKDHVIQIMRRFRSPASNYKFDVDALAKLIDDGGDEFKEWDITVIHGEGEGTIPKWGSATETRGKVRRKAEIVSDIPDVMRIARMMAPRYFKEGIYDANGEYDSKRIEQLEEDFRMDRKVEEKFNVYSELTYLRAEKRRPLLLIFPIEVSGDEGGKKEVRDRTEGLTITALSIGFPLVGRGDEEKYMIRVKANKIYQRWQEIGEDQDDEVISDE
jgi:hypothetical protein